jgi:hypothetical protein
MHANKRGSNYPPFERWGTWNIQTPYLCNISFLLEVNSKAYFLVPYLNQANQKIS